MFNKRKKWPEHRSFRVMYSWPKKSNGELRDWAMNYLYHDGTIGTSLVCEIVVALAHGGRLTRTTESFQKYVVAFLEKFAIRYSPAVSDDDDDVLEMYDERDIYDISTTDEDSDARPARGARPAAPATARRPSISRPATPTTESSSDDDNERLPSHNVSDSASVKVVKVVKAGRVIKGSKFRTWTPNIERDNFYRANPVFPPICLFCAGSDHSFCRKDGTLLCPNHAEITAATPHGPICRYKRCKDPRGHTTATCPDLHHLCQVCVRRGHREEDGCDAWSPAQWAEARADFEDAADLGFWTRRRRSEDRWRFFGARRGEPMPYRYSWYTSKSQTVFTAALLLAGHRGGPARKRPASHSRHRDRSPDMGDAGPPHNVLPPEPVAGPSHGHVGPPGPSGHSKRRKSTASTKKKKK